MSEQANTTGKSATAAYEGLNSCDGYRKGAFDLLHFVPHLVEYDTTNMYQIIATLKDPASKLEFVFNICQTSGD